MAKSPLCVMKGLGSPHATLSKKSLTSPPAIKTKSTKPDATPKSERSAPRAPANRGTYETFGDALKSVRSKPVIRSGYEMLGQTDSAMAKPGTARVLRGPVVNRPMYELVKAGSELQAPGSEAEMAQVVAGGAGSVQIPHETMTVDQDRSDILNFRRPSSPRSRRSPDSVGRRKRRRAAALAAARFENRPYRITMWEIAGIFMVLLTGGIIGLSFHLAIPEPEPPTRPPPIHVRPSPPSKFADKAHHFRDAAKCTESPNKPQTPPSCVFGPLPDHHCGQHSCKKIVYEMTDESPHVFKPRRRIHRITSTTSAKRFCLASEFDPWHEVRVCEDGQCSLGYSGTEGVYNSENYYGVWHDNCDSPNDCWIEPPSGYNASKQLIFNDPGLTKRDKCRTASEADCGNDTVMAAVVWLQHFYCSLNPAMTGVPCFGLPIQLWICQKCNLSGDPRALADQFAKRQCAQDEKAKKMSDGCTIKCESDDDNRFRYLPMPNGAACGRRSYCFQGACLEAKVADDTLMTSKECNDKKKAIEEYWKKFKFSGKKSGR